MIWYFAYGSNLLAGQMAARTGGAFAGTARRAHLPGYRLAFNMADGGRVYANVVRPGNGVLGVLYPCGEQALRALDQFEAGYDRTPVEVVDEVGVGVAAEAYIAKPERTVADDQPSAEYLDRVVRGAREQGLPEEYIRGVEALARGGPAG